MSSVSDVLIAKNTPCPCGSERSFSRCCHVYVSGASIAPTAEALMRSRYVAFVLGRSDYIADTWHPQTRPTQIDLASDETVWLKLNVHETTHGQETDVRGMVAFQAWYGANGRMGCMQERSRFEYQDGRWYYLDGDVTDTSGLERKVGRNELCPCGSGQKHKRCCAPKMSG